MIHPVNRNEVPTITKTGLNSFLFIMFIRYIERLILFNQIFTLSCAIPLISTRLSVKFQTEPLLEKRKKLLENSEDSSLAMRLENQSTQALNVLRDMSVQA
jgi:hypothetical protein